MDKLEIQGNLNELKGKLKKKYAVLRNDDLMYVEGEVEELLAILQNILGKGRDEMVKEIKALEKNLVFK